DSHSWPAPRPDSAGVPVRKRLRSPWRHPSGHTPFWRRPRARGVRGRLAPEGADAVAVGAGQWPCQRRPSGRVREGRVMAPGSVTHWIKQLRAGDPVAAQTLWERYFRRLVGLARQKLRALPRRAADEEDVALSAFDSFCKGAARGRYPHL